jgi:aryl sulfotransferase
MSSLEWIYESQNTGRTNPMFSTLLALSKPLSYVVLTLGAIVAVIVVQFIHFCLVLFWTDQKTSSGNYFQLPEHERQRFKKHLRWQAVLLSPFLWLLAKLSRFRFSTASIQYDAVAFPKGSCTSESVERATSYLPRPEDVFVTTQMKCGTTWMQHIVLQVLTRGTADLPASGVALGAISPWLESGCTISPSEAPLVGSDRPSRIIKSHLPASQLPVRENTRYIYVVRHPVSCFASCVDFLRSNLGPFAPDVKDCSEWYQSEESMWFGTWPDHVADWSLRAKLFDNVLLIRFEDMKENLPKVVERITTFLDMDALQVRELEEVVRKCSFQYMRDNSGHFEMQPPHLLQHSSMYFKSGKTDRYSDVPGPMRQQLVEWCRQKLDGSEVFPQDLYDDLFFPERTLEDVSAGQESLM